MSNTIRKRNVQESSSINDGSTNGDRSSPNIKQVPSEESYNRPVFKLGIVSISMAVLPIATYFGTLGRVFDQSNTTAAAISAIVVTNLILIGYIMLALLEKDETGNEKSDSTKALEKKDN